MEKSLAVKVESKAVSEVFPATAYPAIHTPVVLTFPKVRDIDGKLVNTTVISSEIKGYEPCVVKYAGKLYNGVKVYVRDSGSFKALTTQEACANGTAHAFKTGEAVSITGKAPLLLGKGNTK